MSTNENFFRVEEPTAPMENWTMQGGIQQVLAENVGLFVEVDFLIGSSNMVTKYGILYYVGVSYIVLAEPADNTYVVCDLYAIKFVTFFEPRTPAPNRPPQPEANT